MRKEWMTDKYKGTENLNNRNDKSKYVLKKIKDAIAKVNNLWLEISQVNMDIFLSKLKLIK